MCAEVIFKSQRKIFTLLIKKCYKLYFGCKVGDKVKSWAPYISCATCVKLLHGWKNGSCHMPFAVLIVWTEPKDHSSDCYICSTDIPRISSKSKHMVRYPNLPSSIRYVPHSDKLPVSKPPNNVTTDKENSDADEFHPDQVREQTDSDPIFEQSGPSSKPHFITQAADLKDVIQDSNLVKCQAEISASGLKG
jgi:hypothetical protein